MTPVGFLAAFLVLVVLAYEVRLWTYRRDSRRWQQIACDFANDAIRWERAYRNERGEL